VYYFSPKVHHSPQAPISVAMKTHSVPKRSILTTEDLHNFIHSDTFNHFTGFIESLSNSVKNKTLTSETHKAENILHVLKALSDIKTLVDETDAHPQDGRFGNAAFQTFHDKLTSQAPSLLTFVPKEYEPEVSIYLTHSFGNNKRIDYGTGYLD
jgi:serine/threonine-protein phosphatase 2A activator